MQPPARVEVIERCALCSNCLGKHLLAECRSTRTCSKCSEKHHTTIHDAARSSSSVVPTAEAKSSLTSQYVHRPQTVLLATAMVNVRDSSGSVHAVRALIDPGSEISLVAEPLVQRLRLRRRSVSVPILGVGAQPSGTARGQVLLDIESRVNSSVKLQVNAFILPRLTAYGENRCNVALAWPHLQGLSMADPDLCKGLSVELLLGADIYALILEDGLRKGKPGAPIAQRTSLGWILSGIVSDEGTSHAVTSLQCTADFQLNDLVQRFWKQEEEPASSIVWTKDEQTCEDHFVKTHSRLPDGRYMVRLPIKPGLPELSETRRPAERLLRMMEGRFVKDATLGIHYRRFMAEYRQLDHMTPVKTEREKRTCYLPHHGVWRASSETTKLRVVFNTSQRLHSGKSLNDYLFTGPKLLADLSNVLLRWRRHQYVLAADIEKMYRQIRVHPEDRSLQRVLWRDQINEPVVEYELKTVTYGMACAPFLAIRTLHQLAEDEGKRYPLAAGALRTDTYVDDILTGAPSIEEALELQKQLSSLCMAGGFPLRKWVANDPHLLIHLPSSETTVDVALSWSEQLVHTTLGLQWHPRDDCFSFSFSQRTPSSPHTKRTVLSSVARLFDPLGWLAPVIVTAKIFFQSLWLQRLDWDTPLCERDDEHWRDFTTELEELKRLRVPRFFGKSTKGREIHGFADASERAMAAVVYLRVTNESGTVTSLLTAKTRVAPLKQITLPRLELTAATLLTRLVAHVRQVLCIPEHDIHLWSDSMVALSWIRAHPSRWKTYVANRVSEIQRRLPQVRWHHVMSQENPADVASRGLSPRQLVKDSLWWNGPPWLTSSTAPWAPSVPDDADIPLPEERPTVHGAVKHEPGAECEFERRYSSLDTLLRITAWCCRWLLRWRARGRSSASENHSSWITTQELDEARLRLTRRSQEAYFKEELHATRHGNSLPSRSSLRKLNPFLDDKGILRVGGRLKHSLLSQDEKNPIILPGQSHFTSLIISDVHGRTLHGGVQITLALLRRRYWVLQGRQAVKSHINRCVTCLRWRAAHRQPMMGDLPRDRITPARPFTNTGLDYAGPIHVRTSKGRGVKSTKGYIAIFVCFSTKAVHVELVSDYSTEAFLAAFRRFVSRRGLCASLTSDCGTNFIGADAQLRRLFKAATEENNSIQRRLQKDGVKWHFHPPAAPHFGGLWEAAVKSVKFHLRRVIGDSTLTFEELYTLLTQVEACLNSRPLQALSDDPEDLSPLTPGHFLVGTDLISVPEPSLEDLSMSRLNRWQMVQQMRDHFWRRWSDEYLHTLQSRIKWWRKDNPLRVGDLCLIRNELYPPSRWPLARVTQLHPGEDGHTRVVTLRTAKGALKRPVTKVVPLVTE